MNIWQTEWADEVTFWRNRATTAQRFRKQLDVNHPRYSEVDSRLEYIHDLALRRLAAMGVEGCVREA